MSTDRLVPTAHDVAATRDTVARMLALTLVDEGMVSMTPTRVRHILGKHLDDVAGLLAERWVNGENFPPGPLSSDAAVQALAKVEYADSRFSPSRRPAWASRWRRLTHGWPAPFLDAATIYYYALVKIDDPRVDPPSPPKGRGNRRGKAAL